MADSTLFAAAHRANRHFQRVWPAADKSEASRALDLSADSVTVVQVYNSTMGNPDRGSTLLAQSVRSVPNLATHS